MKLWAFCSGAQLGYSVFDSTSNSWQPLTVVPGVGMSTAPAAIIWAGPNSIHVFHQGGDAGNPNGELWFTYFDGTNWHPDTQVPGVGMSGAPSPIVYGGNLYVFYQGGYENGELRYSVYHPGSGWQPDAQVPGVGMSGSPSAIIWNGRIHVFYQGSYKNGQLLFTHFDGTTWFPETQVQNVGMSESPSTVADDGKLYVFHQGASEDGWLWCSVFDDASSSWEPDRKIPITDIMTGSPAATVWNGRIHVFHNWYDLPYPMPDFPGNIFKKPGFVRAAKVVAQNDSGPADTAPRQSQPQDLPAWPVRSVVLFLHFDGTNWSNESAIPTALSAWAPSLISTS